jgi:hypothetical protein
MVERQDLVVLVAAVVAMEVPRAFYQLPVMLAL